MKIKRIAFFLALVFALPAFAAPLTQEQKEVLAHVLVDPDVWQAHNEATAKDAQQAQNRLDRKLSRWRLIYQAERVRLGQDYKNRAVRDRAAITPPNPPLTNTELLAREMSRPVFGALVRAMAKKVGVTEAAMRAAIKAEMR